MQVIESHIHCLILLRLKFKPMEKQSHVSSSMMVVKTSNNMLQKYRVVLKMLWTNSKRDKMLWNNKTLIKWIWVVEVTMLCILVTWEQQSCKEVIKLEIHIKVVLEGILRIMAEWINEKIQKINFQQKHRFWYIVCFIYFHLLCSSM